MYIGLGVLARKTEKEKVMPSELKLKGGEQEGLAVKILKEI